MLNKSVNLFPVLAFLLMAFIGGCQKQADTAKEKATATGHQAGLHVQQELLSHLDCDQVLGLSIRGGQGSGNPGVSGAERWGIPTGAPSSTRVRRSWSTLSNAEKKQVVDAFIKLKQTTIGSGTPGAERADYKSFCPNGYSRNLYDYYVELHVGAFVSMKTNDMDHMQMAHMGPQFLPWHRYLLLRLEADMQQVLGDPNFTLPYWDWQDCGADTKAGENPCPRIFESEFFGSPGSCTEGKTDVTGYLADQGFVTHIWTDATVQTIFNTDSIRCSTKPLQRQVGCSGINNGKPPSAEVAQGIYDRNVYDAEPYDTCKTDESVSFRQYLEGYSKSATNALCIIAGCTNHGLGHIYIGGDMTAGAAPNDPLFFLHHANVDRLWAMWQDRNRVSSETAVNYGNPAYPNDWLGTIFNFTQVRADEMFNVRALGYRYDTTKSQ